MIFLLTQSLFGSMFFLLIRLETKFFVFTNRNSSYQVRKKITDGHYYLLFVSCYLFDTNLNIGFVYSCVLCFLIAKLVSCWIFDCCVLIA